MEPHEAEDALREVREARAASVYEGKRVNFAWYAALAGITVAAGVSHDLLMLYSEAGSGWLWTLLVWLVASLAAAVVIAGIERSARVRLLAAQGQSRKALGAVAEVGAVALVVLVTLSITLTTDTPFAVSISLLLGALLFLGLRLRQRSARPGRSLEDPR